MSVLRMPGSLMAIYTLTQPNWERGTDSDGSRLRIRQAADEEIADIKEGSL